MEDKSRQLIGEITSSNKTTGSSDTGIIPDSIWLGGLQISIEFDSNLCRKQGRIGEARYQDQLIILDPTATKLQQLEQTYFHELVHWILFVMNENDLRNNEKFVDLFAQFLYQARMTEKRPKAEAGQMEMRE